MDNVIPKLNTPEVNEFLEMFSFNTSADFQYFLHQLSGKIKNSFLRLDISLFNLNKNRKALDKQELKSKIHTSKTMKASATINNNYAISYSEMMGELSDAHHFQLTLLKIYWLHIELLNGNIVTIDDAPTTFNEIIVNINSFEKETRKAILLFNRIRNILVHAPMAILQAYITEAIIFEFRQIISIIMASNRDLIMQLQPTILFLILEKEKTSKRHVITMSEFAKELGVTLKEAISLSNKFGKSLNGTYCDTSSVDQRDALAIIKGHKKIKEQADIAREKQENINAINERRSRASFMVVDIDAIVNSQPKLTEDLLINYVCDIHSYFNIDDLMIFSKDTSKSNLKTIDEILFVANKHGKRQLNATTFEDVEAIFLTKGIMNKDLYIVSNNNDMLEEFKEFPTIKKYIVSNNFNTSILSYEVLKYKRDDILKRSRV